MLKAEKKKESGINGSTHPWLKLHLQELKGAAQSSRSFSHGSWFWHNGSRRAGWLLETDGQFAQSSWGKKAVMVTRESNSPISIYLLSYREEKKTRGAHDVSL